MAGSKVNPYIEPTTYRSKPRQIGDQRARLTPYTWQWAKRPVEGPRGGRRWQVFPRGTYYQDGVFYRIANVPDDPDALDPEDPRGTDWHNAFVPVAGRLEDAHPTWTAAHGYISGATIITDAKGRPQRVEVHTPDGDCAVYWTPADGIDYLEDLTGIRSAGPARKTRAA